MNNMKLYNLTLYFLTSICCLSMVIVSLLPTLFKTLFTSIVLFFVNNRFSFFIGTALTIKVIQVSLKISFKTR